MLHKKVRDVISKNIYGLMLLMTCMFLFFCCEMERQVSIGEKLRPLVLRFHVLAESDADSDQELKLLVRDRLLQEMKGWLREAADKQEAVEVLSGHLGELEKLAEETLRQQGCEQTVQVVLTESWFPVKRYGNLVMPAGNYEALRVSIGSGEGQNWWCMLFPRLCFVEESFEIKDKEAEILQETLTDEEFQAIWQDGQTEVKVRFWLWERLEHFVHRNRTNEELNSK